MGFAKNALFKSYGVIYLPKLPSTLSDKFSTDARNSSGFLSRQRVSTFNDGFCRTTDSSLFSAKELLSFLAYFHAVARWAHVTRCALHNCMQSTFLWLLQSSTSIYSSAACSRSGVGTVASLL